MGSLLCLDRQETGALGGKIEGAICMECSETKRGRCKCINIPTSCVWSNKNSMDGAGDEEP